MAEAGGKEERLSAKAWGAVEQARAAVGLLTSKPVAGITVAQYAAQYGLPQSTASEQLRRMVREGMMAATRARLGYPARICVCYLPVKRSNRKRGS